MAIFQHGHLPLCFTNRLFFFLEYVCSQKRNMRQIQNQSHLMICLLKCCLSLVLALLPYVARHNLHIIYVGWYCIA